MFISKFIALSYKPREDDWVPQVTVMISFLFWEGTTASGRLRLCNGSHMWLLRASCKWSSSKSLTFQKRPLGGEDKCLKLSRKYKEIFIGEGSLRLPIPSNITLWGGEKQEKLWWWIIVLSAESKSEWVLIETYSVKITCPSMSQYSLGVSWPAPTPAPALAPCLLIPCLIHLSFWLTHLCLPLVSPKTTRITPTMSFVFSVFWIGHGLSLIATSTKTTPLSILVLPR